MSYLKLGITQCICTLFGTFSNKLRFYKWLLAGKYNCIYLWVVCRGWLYYKILATLSGLSLWEVRLPFSDSGPRRCDILGLISLFCRYYQ